MKVVITLITMAMKMAPQRTYGFMTPPPLRQHAMVRNNRVIIPFQDDSCIPAFIRNPEGVALNYISRKVSSIQTEDNLVNISHETSENSNIGVSDQPIEFIPIENTYGIELTGGKVMNADGFTGNGIKAAVIDSGIDAKHSGFDSKVKVEDFYSDANGKSYFANSLMLHGTHVAGTIQ